MAKILTNKDSEWYNELNSVAFYSETQFEKYIKQHIKSIFRDYIGFSYKQTVISPSTQGRNRADMVLIRKDYVDWFIIEVELGSDNFHHVKQQIETFVNGDYNAVSMVRYLLKKAKEEINQDLDEEKLKDLISNSAPGVMVMVDQTKAEWEHDINQLGASIFIFEIYRGTNGYEVFRLHGDYPHVKHKETHCIWHKSIANLLHLDSPEVIEGYGADITISYQHKETSWQRMEDGGNVYLKFVGITNPLSPINSYVLYKDTRDTLHIKKS